MFYLQVCAEAEMAGERIRAVALAILIRPRDGALLAVRFPDPDRVFYRPPGGGVEFGESSQDAACREAVEELGHPVRAERLLGVVENIFQHNDLRGHEIVFNWLLRFEDQALYEQEELPVEEMNGDTYTAHWVHPAELAAQGIPLFPLGLAPLLETVT
jgi:ADP-ribose pyrophosphatase YjhB (NUDIX family)